jgi:hypothetical protein
MAYGLKWFSYLSDLLADQRPGVFLVEILEQGFAGTAVRIKSQANAARIQMSDVKDPFDPIRSLKFTFQWMSQESTDFSIDEVNIDSDKKYQLRVSKQNADLSFTVLYYGFLTPVNCEEPLLPKPYAVTLSGTCSLPFLRDEYYLDSTGSFVIGEQSLIKIIAYCLASTGLELPIHTYVNLFEEMMSPSGDSALKLAKIDADGLRGMKAMEVLEGILRTFRAFIVQGNGAWIIKRLKDQRSVNGIVRKFDSNGDSIGTETVVQAATFGRTVVSEDIPNVRPMKQSVKKSIAMQNSIVTNTVSPGIPVNRLENGLFAGAVLGGVIPGWHNHIGAIPWSRAGANMPDNPYRVEFTRHIEFDPKKKKKGFNPYSYFDSGPIQLNLGEFDIPTDKRKEVKLLINGALRMNNALGYVMVVSLNEDERDFASYLDENGDWFYSKKEDRTIAIRSTQSKHDPDIKGYGDLKTQAFEVQSKNITNYVKESGQAIVYVRVRIFPGVQGPGYIPDDVFLSVEDLSVCVFTDLVFEGEHKYQVDAKFPIRNPNPAEYTTTIADKIDIDTPEQVRETNRVMTGYMTLLDGTLTKSWKAFPGGVEDPDDNEYEPIQKKSLRETVRLLCGRRDIVGGTFFGYGIRPDHSMYNPKNEDKFFTITAWEWNIRDMEYTIGMSELNFDPLPDEEIYLYDDEEGRRGNRMYRGVSSGTSGGTSPKEIEEIVLEDVPNVYVTVGVQEIKVVDLAALIESGHKPYDLTAIPTHFTDWISLVAIDRGDDGDELNVIITAKALVPGTDRVLIELIGLDGEDKIVIINVIALPATKFVHTLIDKTGGGNVVVGKLKAGSGYLKPDLWAIETSVDGFHEGYHQEYAGPGAAGSTASPYVVVDATYADDYIAPGSPVSSDVGTFSYGFSTWRNIGDPDNYGLAKADAFRFILFDTAYLNKVKFELWIGGVKLGDIAPDGSSAFNTEGQPFQIKMILDGVLHDTATAVLSLAGVTVKSHVYTQEPSVEDVTYDLYEVLPAAQTKGLYELSFTADEESVNIYERLIAFTINEKKKTAEGGSIKLVSMRPGQSAYDVMGTLSLAGNLFALPASGWNALADAAIAKGTRRSHVLLQKRGGSLIEINTSLHTGRPQYRDYAEDLDEGDYLIFGTDSSLDIDSIHADDTSFRLIVTDELDGEVTEIFSGDFSFGTLEDLDDLPIEEPGGAISDYKAGAGQAETTEDYIKVFRTLVDGTTIEIFEPQAIYDAESSLKNWLRIKNKGVTFAKMQDIVNKSVIGNMSGATGVPHEVLIKDVLEEAGIDDLVTGPAIVTWLTEQLEDTITGTAGFISMFTDAHELGNSVMRQDTGKIGIGIAPAEVLHVAGNILATGQLKSTVATGAAPLVVSSVTLVTNLNADFLDGQHGSYYLDWNNFTNYKSIIAGDGLVTGGPLSADVTVALGTPSTLNSSTSNSVSADSHTHAIATGSIIQGANIVISGDKTNRLVDSSDITFDINAIPWSIVTGTPTTIGTYGITNAYTKAEVDALLSGKANSSHTHTASQITDFTTAGRALISGTGSISYNSSTGVISYTGGASPVNVVGASVNKTARWTSAETPADIADGFIYDDGVTLTMLNPAVQYTGTQSQRRIFGSPTNGMMWFQTDAGEGGAGMYVYGIGFWFKLSFDYVDI